jgi:hypothetical protein
VGPDVTRLVSLLRRDAHLGRVAVMSDDALTYIRLLVAALLPRKGWFAPRAVRVGFVVGRAAQRQAFVPGLCPPDPDPPPRQYYPAAAAYSFIHSPLYRVGHGHGAVAGPFLQTHEVVPWRRL